MQRCSWAENSDIECHYHDHEWGVPLHDDRKLFEFLCLEGAQAGLSWRTVLEKRERYREVFHGFEIERVAAMTDRDLETCLADRGIIRNRMKVHAMRDNARAALRVISEEGSLDAYLWSFVDGTPIRNRWKTRADVPATTPRSQHMSKYAEETRVPVCRTHHLLRLHAGHRHGRRPSGALFPARQGLRPRPANGMQRNET